MKSTFFLLCFSFLLVSCNGGAKKEMAGSGVSSPSPMYDSKIADETADKAGEENKTKDLENVERKLIVSGDVRFRTGDLKKTHTEVLALVEKYKGYIASQNENNSDYSLEQNIQVKIPSKNFNAFLTELSKDVDQFDSKNINTQDVTEEFIDVEARLKTKKELEIRYQQILTKANSVSDIMEVEAQLNGVRAEIESIEGRLKFLDNQTSYSTLSINFYKLSTQLHGFGFRFTEGFKQGWNAFIEFLLAIVSLWPFIFIVLPTFLFLLNRWKKWRSRTK